MNLLKLNDDEFVVTLSAINTSIGYALETIENAIKAGNDTLRESEEKRLYHLRAVRSQLNNL